MVVEEVGGDVSGEEVEEDPLVRGLEGLHVELLLARLVLPEEVQAGHPLHLAAVEGDGEEEDDHHDDRDHVERNEGAGKRAERMPRSVWQRRASEGKV